jgi:hypothetical protein
VQDDGVPVRVAEEGHVADPGIDRVADELHARLLERGPCIVHVSDAKGDAGRVGLERSPSSSGFQKLSVTLPVSASPPLGRSPSVPT